MNRSEIVKLLTTLTQQNAKALELLALALEQETDQAPGPIPEWMPTEQAWLALSLPSAEALRRKVRKGVFEQGYHYRLANHDPQASLKRYEFHIQRCLTRLADPPRNWAKPKRA
jgi:hypothetical protein